MNAPLISSGPLQLRVAQHSPMPLQGSLTCEPGQLLALVGPSGAGKTSMLRVMAGLMHPEQGHMQVGGHTWLDTDSGTALSPQQRHVGLVFQDYALMPHLHALDNVALSLLHLPPAQRHAQAAQWLAHVRLSPEQMRRKPNQLSGGQQQRVAVARALARTPQLLLLDEPFSAVDALNRQGLYDLLADLRASLSIPIVLVTHDLMEARHLADTLVVMDAGQVLQQGAPHHIYRSPRNARVADLVGVQNRFQGVWLGPQNPQDQADQTGWLQWLDAQGRHTATQLRVRDKGRITVGQQVTWVIQGDGLHIRTDAQSSPTPDACSTGLRAQVQHIRNLGDTSLATLQLQDIAGVEVRIARSGPERQHWAVGQTLWLDLACEWVHVMPTKLAPQ